MIYRDGKRGTSYIKRFSVTGVTRDKVYNLTRGTQGSKVLYFTSNPNGEAEVINVLLRQSGSIKKLKWELDFADLEIKGRSSRGNIVTKYSVKKIEFKEKGISKIIVLPLYPQAGSPTTTSTMDAVNNFLSKQSWTPNLRFISGYHDNDNYIDSISKSIEDSFSKNRSADVYWSPKYVFDRKHSKKYFF